MARLAALYWLLASIAPIPFIYNWFAPLCFRFEPAQLQRISQGAITRHGDDIESLMRDVVKNLQVTYPGIIEDFDSRRWVFNVAGGATGQMLILHASITEYLIFFGTAAGTEGHSGVHFADDYFTILSGSQQAAFLGEYKPRVYTPGQQHHHPRFTSAHYVMPNGSWALELAQGFIPAMLPFGLVQMPMALDIDSLWRTVFYTGRSVITNVLRGKI